MFPETFPGGSHPVEGGQKRRFDNGLGQCEYAVLTDLVFDLFMQFRTDHHQHRAAASGADIDGKGLAVTIGEGGIDQDQIVLPARQGASRCPAVFDLVDRTESRFRHQSDQRRGESVRRRYDQNAVYRLF